MNSISPVIYIYIYVYTEPAVAQKHPNEIGLHATSGDVSHSRVLNGIAKGIAGVSIKLLMKPTGAARVQDRVWHFQFSSAL